MTRLRSAAALTLVLALTACGARPPANAPATASRLGCTPATLRAGDTLTVALGRPHAAELALVAPDGTYFVLASPMVEEQLADTAGARLIPAADFASMDRLVLPVATATGLPYEQGRLRNERLFTAPGAYELRLSQNLFTDDGEWVIRCRVTYRP